MKQIRILLIVLVGIVVTNLQAQIQEKQNELAVKGIAEITFKETTHDFGTIKEGEVVGQGTGDLKSHLDVLKENNVKLYVSGMSAKARGYDDSLLDGFNAEFAMPDKLLELSADSNTVLCY